MPPVSPVPTGGLRRQDRVSVRRDVRERKMAKRIRLAANLIAGKDDTNEANDHSRDVDR